MFARLTLGSLIVSFIAALWAASLLAAMDTKVSGVSSKRGLPVAPLVSTDSIAVEMQNPFPAPARGKEKILGSRSHGLWEMMRQCLKPGQIFSVNERTRTVRASLSGGCSI